MIADSAEVNDDADVHRRRPPPAPTTVRPPRNDSTDELAYYLTHSPHPVPLRTLVRVAGQRWRVEESFQTGKGLTGLDEHRVRCWASWHRWVTLAMLAHAFLTVITAAERATIPTPDGLIPITSTSSAD